MKLIDKGRCPKCSIMYHGSEEAKSIKKHKHCIACHEKDEDRARLARMKGDK